MKLSHIKLNPDNPRLIKDENMDYAKGKFNYPYKLTNWHNKTF